VAVFRWQTRSWFRKEERIELLLWPNGLAEKVEL
jgi:hypothetical protein